MCVIDLHLKKIVHSAFSVDWHFFRYDESMNPFDCLISSTDQETLLDADDLKSRSDSWKQLSALFQWRLHLLTDSPPTTLRLLRQL